MGCNKLNSADFLLGTIENATEGAALSFPIPANEIPRLAAVRELNMLDTAPDIAYDEIGELAAQICHCPVAYISFIGSG